ncbi:MAG: DUF3108 domain-containing protein [Sedimentitalea sp.]
MRRRLITAIATLAVLPTFLAATEARFAVQVRGVGVGSFLMSTRENDTGYGISARFAPTPALSLITTFEFRMGAEGRRSGDRYRPRRYTETVRTRKGSYDSTLSYGKSGPVLSGTRLPRPDAVQLSPASQRATLDPGTALFAVLRDQPLDGLCDKNLAIFDGDRRSQLRLSAANPLTCTGRFKRVAGYTAEELSDQRSFDLTVSYAPTPSGLVQATRVTLASSFGALVLQRR